MSVSFELFFSLAFFLLHASVYICGCVTLKYVSKFRTGLFHWFLALRTRVAYVCVRVTRKYVSKFRTVLFHCFFPSRTRLDMFVRQTEVCM